MKKTSILLIFSLYLALQSSAVKMSPVSAGVNESIAAAIKTGNSSELAKYFNNTVEIQIPANEGTFSKSQAEMIVKEFFLKNPPVSYTSNQQGSSNGGAQFMIGTYKSGKLVFHVYILIKPIAGKMLIQQLHFENE
ncbi:MAG: DUF4783 domain-containing protein [Bacteroidales bacterium]